MKNIICIFSGKSNHKWNSNKDYFKSITNHIFNMLNDYKIFIFIGCFPNEVDDWNKLFIEKMKEYNNVTINIYSDLFTQQKLLSELSRFSHGHSLGPWRDNYKLQYGKLYYTFQKAKLFIINNNITPDYVMKLRFDFIYKPDNFFDINWFNLCDEGYLCVSSTELHTNDRWSERPRGGKIAFWPKMLSDQFVFGNFHNMDIFFNLYKSNGHKEYYFNGYNRKCIEEILSNYINFHKVKCVAVDFQFSQPGGPGKKFCLGKNGKWVKERDNKIKYLNL